MAPVSASPAEQAPVRDEAPGSTGAGETAERHSPYRFARPARAEVSSSVVPPEESAPAAHDEPPAEASGNEPAGLGIAPRRTASDVTIRPLRRQDRPAWAPQEQRPGRERGAPPNLPTPAEPYRGRTPDQGQNTPRGPLGRQQRGVPGQPPASRGNAPYTPGGRPPQQGGEAPYGPGNGGAAYGPYTPFEPYTGYPPAGPSEPRQGGQNRPIRGRGYSNAPGYQDQRGQRSPTNRPGSGAPDLYRESGNYGPQNGRGPGRGYSDRRGTPPNRGGNLGGRPRERDTGYGLYTPAPGMAPAENRYNPATRGPSAPAVVRTVEVNGVLWLGGGGGMSPAEVLDDRTLQPLARMNPEDARRMNLRSGDLVAGRAEERGGRRTLVALESVNDRRPEEATGRPQFEQLTASFPDRRIRLEQSSLPVSVRIIDLFAPLGFGSRALIVAPPKTGKTTLIREAAESVLKGYPDAVVMAVLVGERPEEVTDLRARLEPRGGLVYAASFDEDTQRHAWLVQIAVERAKRVAESGRDAFMVLDSLTRLARAENLATRGQGRTLSGGIDAQALDTGRRAFGAARNLEEGGSLTILATCLVDTGSRQDDVVYEEFKGTGNMELHLSRELAQRRLFPAVDAVKSGTRREEMLLTPEELRAATALRRRLADLPAQQATQQLLSVMERTPSNSALLSAIEQSGWTGSMR